MSESSIDKVEVIDTNFIQSDCKAPYLTSNVTGKLPFDLATKSAFDTNIRGAASNIATGNVYYRTPGPRNNPKFGTSGVDAQSLATYNWPSEASTGWEISSSSMSDTYKAFDKDNATTWSSAPDTYLSGGGSVIAGKTVPFIYIKYPSPVLITSITVVAGNATEIKIYGCKKTRDNQIKCSTTPFTIINTGFANPIDISTRMPYDGFRIEFTQSSAATVSTTGIIIKTLFAGTWSTDALPLTVAEAPAKISDINFTAVLPTSILTVLDRLRICYNLLDDPGKFSAYKSQTAGLSVEKYSMSAAGAYSSTNNLQEINTAMTDIFPNASTNLHPDKTNFYAVKRLIKAYEYIIHVYIAMNIESGTGDTLITDLILTRINNVNNEMTDSNSGYALAQTKLVNTTRIYNNRLDRIDKLDMQLEDLKEDVVKEKTNKATNSNILNKNTVVYYVFLLLFIILACVLLYALQKQEDEKSKLYVGGVLATSIVAMILIYFLNMTYLKEGFTTHNVSASNLNVFIETYLTDTINIALLENNKSTYSGVMHVVNKEIDRYDGINTQLKLEAAGTNDIQVDDYRNARVLQYRVYLLLQLLIILSVAMYVYLYTGENIVLFGIVLLLVLFAIYMYIMNTHNMVHTDAKKIYWGQPSIIN